MTKRARRPAAPFGRWLREQGYTTNRYGEVADALACTRSSIYQYAAGRVTPQPAMLKKLTALTGLPVEAFVYPREWWAA